MKQAGTVIVAVDKGYYVTPTNLITDEVKEILNYVEDVRRGAGYWILKENVDELQFMRLVGFSSEVRFKRY